MRVIVVSAALCMFALIVPALARDLSSIPPMPDKWLHECMAAEHGPASLTAKKCHNGWLVMHGYRLPSPFPPADDLACQWMPTSTPRLEAETLRMRGCFN